MLINNYLEMIILNINRNSLFLIINSDNILSLIINSDKL